MRNRRVDEACPLTLSRLSLSQAQFYQVIPAASFVSVAPLYEPFFPTPEQQQKWNPERGDYFLYNPAMAIH